MAARPTLSNVQPGEGQVRVRSRNADRVHHTTPVHVGGLDYEFDIIVYATGFDAMLGAYNRIDIGLGGVPIDALRRHGGRRNPPALTRKSSAS